MEGRQNEPNEKLRVEGKGPKRNAKSKCAFNSATVMYSSKTTFRK